MDGEFYLFDERFAEAFLHSQHVVLGHKLEPFSFWHKVQLEWINSKMLLGNPTGWDLWMAVKICSSQYPNRGYISQKPSSLWKIGWNLRYGRANWEKEIIKFREYLSDYFSPPKTWGGNATAKQRLAEACEALWLITKDQEDAKNAAISRHAADAQEVSDKEFDDSIEAVAVYCKRGGGRPPAEAWNMGIGELYWMNAIFWKMDGGKMEIWTPGDQQRFDAHLLKRKASIEKISVEIIADYPDFTPDRAEAEATVQYWTTVVGNVDGKEK